MMRARHIGMRSFWAVLAWLATLAVVGQPAMAASMTTVTPAGQTITIEICDGHGPAKLKTVELPGAPAQKSDCAKCPSCLAAVFGAALAQPQATAIAWTYQQVRFEAPARVTAYPATAPPRPPSRGPPQA